MKRADLQKMETAEILAFHNKITGKETTKFASRETGIEQTLRAYKEYKKGLMNKAKPKGESKAPREGTKRRIAYDLIARPEGATMREIMAATGWDFEKARGGIRCIWNVLNNGIRSDEATGKIFLSN